ncbi:hypothetical protein HDU87_004839 [Geranomyces variabilis]|uniref:CHK kinase-like domain-containing protein n=1 Tax=Geranomyces variabilis TaxID=109894 RepID=A0AAD5XPJ5_9FUNG|nr:hypothetical protein HDU87_004839 [Geranomyces variabilis]
MAQLDMHRDDLATSLLPPGYTVRSFTKIATLWAGYGSVSRLKVDGNSLILKEINLSERKKKDTSHTRKVTSYHVEAEFYKPGGLAESLLQSSPWAAIPKPLGVRVEQDRISLLLSDLLPAFPREEDELDFTHAKSAMRWLAGWHAHFWGSETDKDRAAAGPVAASGVWKEGGYWYLATRMEELESIGSESKWKQIKDAAFPVAQRLRGPIDGSKSGPSRFRTVVHGDPKSANILFADQPGEDGLPACAFFDMQYVGFGYGAVDIAYLLATSVNVKALERNEASLLETYLCELQRVLKHRGLLEDARDYTMDVLKLHLDLALIDWVRFMAGWGMWGNSAWAERKARQALAKLQLS